MADQSLVDQTKNDNQKTIVSLSEDLKKIRTGRAQVSMLDSVSVNYYGSPTPLTQVASVTCPDAKSFMIAPWEASLLKEIEASIVRSDIGMSPINDGKVIRLRLPELTEERRKELVKQTKKVVEEAKVAVRLHRRDANDTLKTQLKEKKISEDEQKKTMDLIQKTTDESIKKIEGIADEKELSIMTI